MLPFADPKQMNAGPSVFLIETLRQAQDCMDQKSYAKAMILCEQILKADKTNARAHSLLGKCYLNVGQRNKAIDHFALAVTHDPSSTQYKQDVIDWFNKLEIKKINPYLKMVLIECMQDKDVLLMFFHFPWLSLLKNDPEFSKVIPLMECITYEAFHEAFVSFKTPEFLVDPFFLTGLGRFIIPSRTFENFMIHLRRVCLEFWIQGKSILKDEQHNEFITGALSRYAFFTEYVWNEEETESRAVDQLKANLEATNTPKLSDLMLYACYRPIYDLRNAREIFQAMPALDDHVSSIPRQQIENFFHQQEIKKTIKSLNPIEDEVSKNVQAQYEEFPYPSWEALPRDFLNKDIESRFIGKKANILVAGCGTGQEALHIARLLPDARVVAADLSRSSLTYAIMRSEQLGIKNVEFYQADIMALGKWKERFDYIASSGVLHHMHDPKAGWKILLDLLKPSGLMRIALYSRTARATVIEARRVIAEKKIGNDANSIRQFRKNVEQHLDKKYITFLDKSFDYYSLNMCRDLFFHVQEHQFDLPQIKAVLEEFNLKLLSFQCDSQAIEDFKKKNKKQQDLLNLDLWDQYEKTKPDTFVGMYSFFCEKSS